MRSFSRALLCLNLIFEIFGSETIQTGQAAVWTYNNQDLALAKSPQPLDYRTTTVETAEIPEMISENHGSNSGFIVYLQSKDGKAVFGQQPVWDSVTESSKATVIPHVYSSRGSHDACSKMMENAPQMSLTGFKQLVAQPSSSATEPAKVIVQMDETSETAAALRELTSSLSVPVTFLAFKAPSPSAFAPEKFGDYHRILAVSSDKSDGLFYSPEGSEYSIYYASTYLYITPDIFTGIMTGLFMFFVLLIGYSCLGDIQGSSSFVKEKPLVGREA